MFSFSFCCYHLFPGDKDSRNSMTSCCSTESERPHRCCQLPNNFGLRTILYNGLGDAPKNCPFPWGSRTPPIKHGTLGLNKLHLQWFSRFSTAHGCEWPTDTHTETCYTCSNRPHLSAACTRCSQMISNSQRTLTWGRISAANGFFCRIRQVAPICTPIILAFGAHTSLLRDLYSRYFVEITILYT